MSEPAKTWAWWAVSILWCLGCAVTGVCLKGGCSSRDAWVDASVHPVRRIGTNEGVRYIWVDGSPTNITIKGVTFFGTGSNWTGSVVGEPEHVSWWREGHPATRAEAEEGVRTGLPLLREKCGSDLGELVLGKAVDRAVKYLPEE